MHSRRALLYMPGDDRRKIEKSTTLGVDCICMDMEDGVAISRKMEARAVIAQAMKDLDFGNSERCIRINSFGSGLEKFDLVAALATNPDSIVVPKIETAEQVRWVSDHIETYELSSNMNHWKYPFIDWCGNSKRNSESQGNCRSRQASRSHHLRRGGLRRLHWRDAHKRGDRSVICALRRLSLLARRTICRRSTWSILTSAMKQDCASKRSRERDSASAGNRSFTRIRCRGAGSVHSIR